MSGVSFFGSKSLCQPNKHPQSSFDAFIFSSARAPFAASAPKCVGVDEKGVGESKQKRKRSKACERCKRFKLKCDVGRPCRNCVGKGCGQQCTDEIVLEENAMVEAATRVGHEIATIIRPFGFQGRAIELPRESADSLPQTKNEYLTRLVGGGVLFQLKAARDLVESLTPDICDSLISGIEALQLINGGSSTVSTLKEHRGRSRALVQNTHSRGRIVRILEDDYCEDPVFVEVGHMKDLSYPPMFSFNRKFAQLMGLDADDLLEKAARSDLSLPCPEVEYVACMIDSVSGMPSGGRHVYTRWQRGYWSGGKQKIEALFVEMKCEIKVVNDELIQESRVIPISPEEYEAARMTHPARCRPVLSAMGDTRNASDLLRDVEKDNRQTLRSLRKTPDGRRQLQAMASEIKHRFAPILCAASSVQKLSPEEVLSPATTQPDTEPYALLSPSSALSYATSPGTPGAFVESPSAEAAWGGLDPLEPCTSSTSSSSSDWSASNTVVTDAEEAVVYFKEEGAPERFGSLTEEEEVPDRKSVV